MSSVGALAIVMTVALASPASAKIRHQPEAKPVERVNKGPFGDVPKGPMQIVVSINQQKLHLYSDGREVAETSVATGVPQLPTPTGVFSVIQKQRFHRSNIYSGAPMPFMQRITWSGVAIHEGENIGHPASHGCIRMPHDFAVRLYDFTKVGVRVVVAREELKPVDIADPHLFVHKAAPPPPAPAPEAATAPAPAAAAPAATEVTTAGDPTKTADAGVSAKTDVPVARAMPDPATATKAAPADTSKATGADAPAQSATAPAATEQATKSAEATAPNAEDKVADAATPAKIDTVTPAAAPSAPEATKTTPADETKTAEAAPPSMPQPAAPTPTEQLRGTLIGGTSPGPSDGTVPVPAAKPPGLIEMAAATHGPIAIFISRKTQKLYVRQNFAPLFEAPITIAQPDQAVGTTVFTAMKLLDDGTTFRWNVITFPGEPPRVKRVVETRRGRRTVEEAAKPTGTLAPPQTPAEVLARIQIPQDVLDRVSELMVPGSSLIVSDQGLGDETGEGTDFIVVTR